MTSSATEKPRTTVAGPEPTQIAARPAAETTPDQATGSHSRARDPPRNQAIVSAPAVAGTATAAGSATHSSCSRTPNTVHATPLIVEFASAAMLTPAALVIRRSLRNCGTV